MWAAHINAIGLGVWGGGGASDSGTHARRRPRRRAWQPARACLGAACLERPGMAPLLSPG